jgi:hypothetical protein
MMTDPTPNIGYAAPVKQTHPVRGVLWGIMFGLGLVIVLILTKIISLDLVQALIVFVIAVVVGTVWSLYGPAKAPKTPAPSAQALPLIVHGVEPPPATPQSAPQQAPIAAPPPPVVPPSDPGVPGAT